MKRLSFLAALFGGSAIAQQWKACKQDKRFPQICSSENMPALENQCPVCGTMAESYKRAAIVRTTDCDPIPGSQFVVACKVASDPIGEPSRIARCKRCNAAFWQDAEGEK